MGVGERDIPVLTPKDDDWLVVLVNNLASEILLLDKGADAQLNCLERTGGSDGWLVLTLGACKDGLATGFGGLIAKDNADLVGVGADLLECWVTNDVVDFSLLAESPGTLVTITESDVCVCAADQNDGLIGRVEDLATLVWVLDVFAELELDGLEGSELGGRLHSALAFGENVLSAGLA